MKTNKYNININHDSPSLESFIKYGVAQAYPVICVYMNIYEENKVIYEIDLIVHGNYYCCEHFRYDKIQKNITTDCDENIKIEVYDQFNNEKYDEIKNVFHKSLLDRYVDELLEYLFDI
jgi:hypothetical protein